MIVIIPIYRRPEMLYWCLWQIKKADEAKENYYIFAADIGAFADGLKMANSFLEDFHGEILRPDTRIQASPLAKQSRNILEAYRIGAKLGEMHSQRVTLIEEDVMIHKQYFKWHAAYCEMLTFCRIASVDHNPNEDMRSDFSGNAFLITASHYQSIGVSFTADVLTNLILPHVNRSYYNDPKGYMSKFDTPLNDNFCEQDGLIRRIGWSTGMMNLFPKEPLCYHAGFYGKNRPNHRIKRMSNLSEKIDLLGSIIFDAEKIKLHAGALWADCVPISL